MKKHRYSLPEKEHDESTSERLARLASVGTTGPLYQQFYNDHPAPTSDLRERILSGAYFKLTDE